VGCRKGELPSRDFDTQGKYIGRIGELAQPCHAYVDDEETVFIPESIGLSMAICTTDGKLLARWHNHELEHIMRLLIHTELRLTRRATSTWSTFLSWVEALLSLPNKLEPTRLGDGTWKAR